MISHMASIPKTFFHINVHRHTIVGKVVLRWYDLAIHSDPRLMEKFRMCRRERLAMRTNVWAKTFGFCQFYLYLIGKFDYNVTNFKNF